MSVDEEEEVDGDGALPVEFSRQACAVSFLPTRRSSPLRLGCGFHFLFWLR
jgi:hypothetical protein